MRAGLSCFDDSNLNRRCDNALVRALPKFELSGEFWDQKAAPYTMRYRLIKYAIGRNCRLQDQPVQYEPKQYRPNEKVSVWLCESLSVYDGTLNAEGGTEPSPRSFHSKELTTVSSQRMEALSALQEEPALNPMHDFIVESWCKIGFSDKQLVCEER
jgi:hypothetical protein